MATQKQKNNLNEALKGFAVVMMTAAVTLGIVELPQDEEKRRAVVPARPVFEFAGVNQEQGTEPQRREREESGPHYISYGVAQRSPGRTGRL